MARHLGRQDFESRILSLMLMLMSCWTLSATAAGGQASPCTPPAGVSFFSAQGHAERTCALVTNYNALLNALTKANVGVEIADSGRAQATSTEAASVLSMLDAAAGGDQRKLDSLVSRTCAITSKFNQMTLTNGAALAIDENTSNDNTRASAQQKQETTDGTKSFLGMKWGLGVALTSSLGHGDIVSSATLVNHVVKVQQTTNQQPRIVLELHHFFCAGQDSCVGAVDPTATTTKTQTSTRTAGKLDAQGNGSTATTTTTTDQTAVGPMWGHGPWVGIQSSSDQVINAFALGYMVGWRKDAKSSSSFNLGLGVVVDAKSQILDGVKANETVPVSVTAVPLKNVSRTGAIVVASFGF